MASPKLTPKKPSNSDGTMTLKVGQPAVNVRIPPIRIPDIKVPESRVNVDMSSVSAALQSMAQALTALSAQQATILQAIAETNQAITRLAGNQPNIEVAAPVVKMPPRPRSYQVTVEGEDGETTYMNIQANSPN